MLPALPVYLAFAAVIAGYLVFASFMTLADWLFRNKQPLPGYVMVLIIAAVCYFGAFSLVARM